MIDAEKVKAFWQTRGDKLGKMPFESIANLEEKEELLQLKVTLEQEKIMPLLGLHSESKVLDLGAGVGQWTFRFAPLVKHVTAVEFMSSLVDIGREEARRRDISNVEFIVSPAELFRSTEQFDLIFISGLFVYLNPDQAEALLNNLPTMLNKGGAILVRDGTSILEKSYRIDNRYSDILHEAYSAFYRTRSEYVSLFEKAGFRLDQDGQVFEEGCPLNKFPETRLWYYLFQ